MNNSTQVNSQEFEGEKDLHFFKVTTYKKAGKEHGLLQMNFTWIL